MAVVNCNDFLLILLNFGAIYSELKKLKFIESIRYRKQKK